jgi:hypothetical protein
MKGVLAGVGVREALELGGEGRVVASFRRASYLEVAGAMVVVVAPGVDAGPIHLVLDADPPTSEPGRGVSASRTEVSVDGVRIDVAGAEPWQGRLPSPAAVRERAHEIGSLALASAAGSALARVPFDASAGHARTHLEAGRLEHAADRLAGLGPGLTPSGDDALAGIVFGLRIALGHEIEPRTASVVGALPPGSLASAFVTYAARGQALAPVHDLVEAVVDGDAVGATVAAEAVARIGETSGRDLLLGLGWAMTAFDAYELAAAGAAPDPRPAVREVATSR